MIEINIIGDEEPADVLLQVMHHGMRRSYIYGLYDGLPADVKASFTPARQAELRRAMLTCRMTSLPAVTSDFDRANGAVICQTCSNTYRDHPLDWRTVGYDSTPYLNILCDGRQVKL